ncbi:hypothetical protein RA263_25580, partial [Pseudomonas syringae pv. tagetis]
MNNLTSSDLTFPMLEYAKNETPWDLAPLLYSGGARAKVQWSNDSGHSFRREYRQIEVSDDQTT